MATLAIKDIVFDRTLVHPDEYAQSVHKITVSAQDFRPFFVA
jgi:hypothetical protein